MKIKKILIFCLKFFIFHSICSIILNGFALYNKFPVFYSDSGTYINCGFENSMPLDKPFLYCFFIRHSSLGVSLWFTIYFQGFIISYLLQQVVKLFYVRKNHLPTLILINFTLAFFTPISIYVGQIMPDIFISATYLSLLLLIFHHRNNFTNNCLICLLFVLSAGMHISNAIVLILMIFTLTASYFIFKIRLKKAVIFFSLCSFAIIFSPIVNYLKDNSFVYSKTTHVVLMARMSENGILKKYFKDYSQEANKFNLYNYKDSLPTNSGEFLWGVNSPLYKTGGWGDSKIEYSKIISDTYKKPKLLVLHIVELFKSTLKQLTIFEAGSGLGTYKLNTPPYYSINKYFNYEMNEYGNSLQNFSVLLNLTELNQRHLLIFTISLLGLCFILFIHKIIKPYSFKTTFSLIVYTLLFLIYNAFACGGISVVDSRYQNRIIWIVPFIFMLILLNHINFETIITNLKTYNKKRV